MQDADQSFLIPLCWFFRSFKLLAYSPRLDLQHPAVSIILLGSSRHRIADLWMSASSTRCRLPWFS